MVLLDWADYWAFKYAILVKYGCLYLYITQKLRNYDKKGNNLVDTLVDTSTQIWLQNSGHQYWIV